MWFIHLLFFVALPKWHYNYGSLTFWQVCLCALPWPIFCQGAFFVPTPNPGYAPPGVFDSLFYKNILTNTKKGKNPGGTDQKTPKNMDEKPPGILRRVQRAVSVFSSKSQQEMEEAHSLNPILDQTDVSLFYFAYSSGGACLYNLLAALPHRQEPVCPGGHVRHSHAEPELQHGLHGAVLPQRFHQPCRLQPHVKEVQSCSQTPLLAAPEAQTSPQRPEAALRYRPHLHPEWKPYWGLRGLGTGGLFGFITKRMFAGFLKVQELQLKGTLVEDM